MGNDAGLKGVELLALEDAPPLLEEEPLLPLLFRLNFCAHSPPPVSAHAAIPASTHSLPTAISFGLHVCACEATQNNMTNAKTIFRGICECVI
jgi:hypothetical protein